MKNFNFEIYFKVFYTRQKHLCRYINKYFFNIYYARSSMQAEEVSNLVPTINFLPFYFFFLNTFFVLKFSVFFIYFCICKLFFCFSVFISVNVNLLVLFEMPKEVFWRPKKSPMRVFVLPDHTCPNTEVWGTQIRYMLMITHTEGRKKYNMDSQGIMPETNRT